MRRIGAFVLLWALAGCTDEADKATDIDTEPVDTELVDTEPGESDLETDAETDAETDLPVDTEVVDETDAETGDTGNDTFMPPVETGIFVPGDTSESDLPIDTEVEPPPEPDVCSGFRVYDCNDDCFSSFLLGDGLCHNGSNPLLPDFDCEEHAFDGGDCLVNEDNPEVCTDPLAVNDCAGACYPLTWIGDGQCDDGTTYAHGSPDFNCADFQLDQGDCALAP
jgi:hypothetical protein